MKQLFDLFPVILFFITYKFYDFYMAIIVIMIASALQIGMTWFKNRRFETMHVLTFFIVMIFGSATLLFKNEMFFKWKPTVVNWIFAVVFFVSQFIGEKPLIQRMMENNVSLASPVWRRLNTSWVVFFIIMGGLNLYVAYTFSTNTWVNFKLFGILGLTLLFVIIQSIYLTKHIDVKDQTKNNA